MNISPKILSLAVLALLAVAPASQALADTDGPPPPPSDQSGPPPRMRHMREDRLKQIDEAVHLTADQKPQVKALFDKAAEQGRALWKDESLSREDRRAKMMEIMKATHEQVRALLTADQQKLFDAMPMGRGRRGPPPPPPAEKSE